MRRINKYAPPLVLLLTLATLLASRPTIASPTVEIISPIQDAEISYEGSYHVVIIGKASEDTDHVTLTHSTKYGTFPGISVTGTTSWTRTLLATTPGLNTIEAVAFDKSGRQSAVAKRTFNFIVKTPISLSSTGAGRIEAPFNTSAPLVVGNSYDLKAVPRPKHILQSWTLTWADQGLGGDTNIETAPNISFTMDYGLSVLATFIPNPYPPLSGVYIGVLRDGTSSPSGYVRLTLSPSGMSEGTIQLQSSSYRFSGQLNGLGFYNTSLAKNTINLSVQAGLDATNPQVVVSLNDTNAENLGSAVIPAGKPPVLTGAYTLLFPPDNSITNAPQGNGYAFLNISPNGSARVIGYLADGTPFVTASQVNSKSSVPIYVSLDNGKGSLGGDLHVQPGSSQVVGGTLRWNSGPLMAALDTQGSTFRSPSRSETILNLSTNKPNAKFIALGSDLSSEQQEFITVESNGKVNTSSVTNQLVISINKGNGFFNGSFLLPNEKHPIRFSGVLLQEQGFGAGFFIHDGVTGQVFIESN